MALTQFQRTVCRLIAETRIAGGESYVAGATALNLLLGAPRISSDVDVFHDAEAAVLASWNGDQKILEAAGFSVRLIREQRSFIEAEVARGEDVVLVQWVRDSAYRFFPLLRHEDLGLALHPFDLATNKVLALVGRLEVRDWVDVIECDQRLQPLGLLAWAACAKDPGFSPFSILEHAARSSHYSQIEVDQLAFEGAAPDAGSLARRWRTILDEARNAVRQLPAAEAGKCVLDRDGSLYSGSIADLGRAVRNDDLLFHAGSIRGALPQIVEPRID